MVFFRDYFLMDVELLGGVGRTADRARDGQAGEEGVAADPGPVPLQRLALEDRSDEGDRAGTPGGRPLTVAGSSGAATARSFFFWGHSTMKAINGLNIHHEMEGEGPPIVFVHGLGATSNVWHAQRMALRHYYRVIIYDRSGSGRSQKSRDGYSIDAWADELAGLLDHLAIPEAVVVGHSLGSMVAQRFSGRYAKRTKALVLAGGEAEVGPEDQKALTERARTIEAHGLSAVVGSWLTAVLSAATREANPALAGLVREMFLSNDAKTYALHCLALRDADVRSDHANIVCPTLLTVGDQDRVTPLSWQRQIAVAIANSRIRIIPNTGHMTMLESPAVFNTVLLDFLAAL
jgi:3-oxoadipate enol-lactonase